ncbi:hypothetical protein ABZ709_32480 [Streptomyces albus]|uniref:hypothetical protein n=1 Tax=Streptomyces albus TaxID=1888 RepID=UPI0033C50DBD
MAVDTVPPVPEGPPDPPTPPAASTDPAAPADSGIMAALLAAVEPARPVAATGAGARPAGDDPAAKADPDVVDRSSPGLTSASFKAPQDLAGSDSDAAGTRYKEGVIKSLIRAGATRWAKGGGTANKRLDLAKARAAAHQVKETRTTTTVTKSPGLPSRGSSGGSGGGGRNSGGSSGGNSGRSSSGNSSVGAGRSGSGGGSGGGGRGSSGSNGSGGSGGGRGTSGTGTGSASKDSGPKDSKGTKDSGSKGKDGSSGNGGAAGKSGKDGKGGAASSGGGSPSGGSSGGSSGSAKDKTGKDKGAKADRKKSDGQSSGGSSGSGGGSGSSGGPGKHGKDGKDGGSGSGADKSTTESRSPLQRSRETGHGDGTAVRNAFDHVKAYAKGAKDGYQDTKAKNSKEHARLDKAHAQRNATKDAPKGTTVTGPGGRTLVIAPPDEGDDGVSTDVQPLQVQEIDANALTLGAGGAQGQVSRKELRNFKQYERKLEAKVAHLVKIADACKALQRAAEDEAKDCQQLADQGKAVEGGEKLAAKLTKLADQAKAQAAEAAELHRRSRRAVDMCKTVLTNIGTRYAPLYKAVVDSDETKPAELRFYTDKGSYAPAA